MEITIDYNTPYITKEEYLETKGVDLSIELQDNDNKSDKVNRFIKDITNFIRNKLVIDYQCNDLNDLTNEFSELKEFRRKQFHKGMIEEIEYILNNGLLHQDSGVNTTTGMIVDYSNIIISMSAYNEFFKGAFCNIRRG